MVLRIPYPTWWFEEWSITNLEIKLLSIPTLRSFVIYSWGVSSFGPNGPKNSESNLVVRDVVHYKFRDQTFVHSNFKEFRGLVIGSFEVWSKWS